MPIVSVTPLGSNSGDAERAIPQIVDYLHRGLRRPEPNVSISDYYADTPTGPGVWRGRGVGGEQLLGPVDPDMFRMVLFGAHPHTGVNLVAAAGSSARARATQAILTAGPSDELLNVRDAASTLGVKHTYVQRLALATEQNPDTKNPLVGQRDEHGRWWFRRDDLERFAAQRKEQKVVVAYDVTVSFEKSISLVWARANSEQRRTIEQALDAGTNAAVAYLEDQALAVRRGRSAVKADGVWAASFRHMTNRNLEPQLHDHVVIANIGAADGRTQALDSRLLHHHAKTAGYVAGAVTRQHLTETLGIAWQPVERGLADIDGVSRQTINAFSTRRTEITTLTEELGVDSAAARNIAARTTRVRKDELADWSELEKQWASQLDHLGLTTERWSQLQHQPFQRHLDATDEQQLAAFLESSAGVTKSNAVFSRKDIVQAIVEWDGTHGTGTRLDYNDIDRITDTFLTSPNIVALDMTPAQITRTGETHWYSTVAMLDLERAVISNYTNARSNHSLAPEMVDAARTTWETTTGHTLGDDQARMVDAITTSRYQFLPVVGPAGTGKTAALNVAARAWTTAGYKPLGASVTGTATEVLAESAGIPTRTVASLIAELNAGGQPFTERTVLLVDEASTLSNRDHHALMTAIKEAGGLMRTIGDPAQHRSVEAGGLWAHLVTDLADRIPVLDTDRRQAAPEMTDVRLANADYRNGLIDIALERLHSNDRIVTAATADELLDHLTADWYADRTLRRDDPSRMMAESHTVRRQLNQRAQALLRADGTLTGTPIAIDDERFHIGDQVITRTQDRNLKHSDGHFLRNGATGTVTAIGHDANGDVTITVDFQRHGTLTLPYEFLTRRIRPGIDGGLTPGYAITTHAAQGSTYRTGRMLTTDTSSKEGVYVGLTRGTSDTRLYLVASDSLTPNRERSDMGLPILRNTRNALDALADHLSAPDPATVVTATDPDARLVHNLRTHTITELQQAAQEDLGSRRALRQVADVAARQAIQFPTQELVARFGSRPPIDSPIRSAWDETITRVVEHNILHTESDTSPHAQRSRSRVAASIQRLDTLASVAAAEPARFHIEAVADLAAQLRLARGTLPLDDQLISTLSSLLDRHIDKAVASQPNYLTDLIGERPEDERTAARWDHAATSIERVRHHNGLTPDAGPYESDSALRRAVGNNDDDRLRIISAQRAIDAIAQTASRTLTR